MKIKKLLPLNDTIKNLFTTKRSAIINSWNIPSAVSSAFNSLSSNLLDDYIALGMHLVGKWEYDTETEEYNYTGVSELIDKVFRKYKPYFLVLTNEVTALNGNLIRQYYGSNSGTRRSAAETSPITVGAIDSAPEASSEWDLANPTSKAGSQYDNANSSTETTTDPNLVMKVLDFNVGELNLTRLTNMLLRSLLEEYCTIY